MSEVAVEEKVVTAKPNENKEVINIASNPFDDNYVPPAQKVDEIIKPAAPVDGLIPIKSEGDDAVDADEFLAKETGWKTWDEAKAAKAELDEFKKQPKAEQAKFTPEEREKLFEDAYPILQSKKQLERVEKLDATKPKDAAEIIKLDLLLKNKDLSQDDVDFIFSEKYDVPEKPKKTDDIDDDDYAAKVAKWENQVERINRRLSVDAKLAKPELSKFKSELVLPDIPKFNQQPEAPTQESLDAAKAIRENYLRAVDTDFSQFDGFTTQVKDESVEYPVKFNADEKDRADIKKLAQEMNIDDYFGKRWFDEKGNTKVKQLMSDLFLLEKTEKAFQGVANHAASERRKEIIKQNSNIKLNGVTTKVDIQRPPEMEKKHREEAAIWSA